MPVEFRRFRWSGVNSHTHRLAAAAGLRQLLKQSVNDYPSSSHFVVAHSHGGNVACYAMQDDGLRDAVRGVICLGTPFLHVQRNPLPRSLLSPIVPTLAISVLLAAAYLVWAPQDPVTKYFAVGVMALAVPVIALLVWALLRKQETRLRWRDIVRARRSPAEFEKQLAFPVLGSERLLAVRISGDEAAGALTASQFFVWLFRTTWGRLAPIWERLEQVRRASAPLVGFILLAVLVLAEWLAVIPLSHAEMARGIAIVFLGLFGAVALVVGLSAYGILVLMLLMHVPVGLDAMLGSLDIQTTAEPTPPGEATVFHAAPRDDDVGVRHRFRHSAVYEDPEVIRFIASWIRGRL